MKTLYGSTPKEIESLVFPAGLPKYRADQLLDWIYKKTFLLWEEIRNLPKELLEKLSGKRSGSLALEPGEEKKATKTEVPIKIPFQDRGRTFTRKRSDLSKKMLRGSGRG